MSSGARKVLIIGKHSYIGQNFIHYCENIENDSKAEMNENIVIDSISAKEGEWLQKDFSGYDTILLLSGIAHVHAEASLYYKVNYEMAVNIARKAKESKVKQFIFMSTIAVFGNTIQILENEIPMDPQTEYAKTKKMAEDEIKKMQTDHFQIAIVRPPMVYGKDCPGNFTKLLHLIQKIHVFPKVQNERSTIYIWNLCEFIRLLILRQCGGCYVPQNPEYLCSSDVARVIRETGNTRVYLLPGLNWIIQLGARTNSQFRKVFGNYQYPMELSIYEEIPYQKYQTRESLKLSI